MHNRQCSQGNRGSSPHPPHGFPDRRQPYIGMVQEFLIFKFAREDLRIPGQTSPILIDSPIPPVKRHFTRPVSSQLIGRLYQYLWLHATAFLSFSALRGQPPILGPSSSRLIQTSLNDFFEHGQRDKEAESHTNGVGLPFLGMSAPCRSRRAHTCRRKSSAGMRHPSESGHFAWDAPQ